jgi:hypothetical protein
VRAPPPFDPGEYDYGPATVSVRQLLRAWMEIDWLAPSAHDDKDGIELFREHQARAHAFDRKSFAAPGSIEVRVERGGADELAALCARVRGDDSRRDWKLGELKRLSLGHARARGWSLEAFARTRPWPPRPGDLCFVMPQGGTIWTGAYPKLAGADDATIFYVNYAHGDLLDACQWQLARGDDDTATNPFVPFLDGYVRGFYPVSLEPTTVVLFRARG